MGAAPGFIGSQAMASPYRRRRICTLDGMGPVALRAVSGRGATVETAARIAIGTRVTLDHPEAGSIEARVTGHDERALRLAFSAGEAAIAFALAATAADMTRG